jgi:hypothetical protein
MLSQLQRRLRSQPTSTSKYKSGWMSGNVFRGVLVGR